MKIFIGGVVFCFSFLLLFSSSISAVEYTIVKDINDQEMLNELSKNNFKEFFKIIKDKAAQEDYPLPIINSILILLIIPIAMIFEMLWIIFMDSLILNTFFSLILFFLIELLWDLGFWDEQKI